MFSRKKVMYTSLPGRHLPGLLWEDRGTLTIGDGGLEFVGKRGSLAGVVKSVGPKPSAWGDGWLRIRLDGPEGEVDGYFQEGRFLGNAFTQALFAGSLWKGVAAEATESGATIVVDEPKPQRRVAPLQTVVARQATAPRRIVWSFEYTKCPHCGKRLKVKPGGWRRYAVCHHCGRHVDD